MATQTLSAADAILKDMYVGPIVEQLNNKTYMLDQIERDSDHIDHTGRRAIVPIHTGRNRGRGARGDAGTLPVAGTQTWQDAIVNITYQYQGIEISDGAIQASKSNEGAFINLLNAETKGASNDLKKDMNRQIFGTGDGLLASVAASYTTTTLIGLDSVQYVAVGDPVDVVRKTDGSATAGVLATTITVRTGGTTKTVSLAAATAATVDTNYGIYISGDRSQETNGLRNIVSKSRSLHSINSATAGNEFWDATVLEVGESAAAPAVAGESSFELLADNVGFNGNGEVEVFLTSRGIRRRLADQFQGQKRFTDANAVNIHGGYKAIMVNDMPVIADDDCPRGWAFGLNKDSFRWYEQAGGPGWLEGPGGGGGDVFRLKAGTTAGTNVAVWQAYFRWYCNLGNVAPNRNGALKFCKDDDPS
jgi:hypothetical protein